MFLAISVFVFNNLGYDWPDGPQWSFLALQITLCLLANVTTCCCCHLVFSSPEDLYLSHYWNSIGCKFQQLMHWLHWAEWKPVMLAFQSSVLNLKRITHDSFIYCPKPGDNHQVRLWSVEYLKYSAAFISESIESFTLIPLSKNWASSRWMVSSKKNCSPVSHGKGRLMFLSKICCVHQ